MKLLAAAIAVVVMGSVAPKPGLQTTKNRFSSMVTVPLKNGPNQLDVDADGRVDMVFVAYRENFNAHSFTHITFYRSAPGTPTWQLIPFFNKSGPPLNSFETYQGADCVLRDLRVLRPSGKSRAPVLVIVADRPLGASFVDEQPVTFTVYKVVAGEAIAGEAPLYFSETETIKSKARYCDVGQAFRSELGIADDGRQGV